MLISNRADPLFNFNFELPVNVTYWEASKATPFFFANVSTRFSLFLRMKKMQIAFHDKT